YWQREQIELPPQVISVKGNSAEYPSNFESAGIEKLRLHVRARNYKDFSQITVSLINDHQDSENSDFQERNENCFYQTELSIKVKENAKLIPRENIGGTTTEEKLNSLLYRNAHGYAVGHTCSASWDAENNIVRTDWLPQEYVQDVDPRGDPLIDQQLNTMEFKSFSSEAITKYSEEQLLSLLSVIPDSYEKWIDTDIEKEKETVPEELLDVANNQINFGRDAIRRMRQTIALLKNNPDAMKAFFYANEAMVIQAKWQGYKLDWRPFQLAFSLLTIESIVDKSIDRNIMDLLWFPTGGGKTEAYLFLIAYTLFYRRLERGSLTKSDGVCVISRYTLRALTSDQFQRSASLICAAELIRIRETGNNNKYPFSIGLWIGKSNTPNKYKDAVTALKKQATINPKAIEKCPCCNGALEWGADERNELIIVKCLNNECELGEKCPELPIHTVDEQIYRIRPSFIIATVDKFFQIIRFPTRTNNLFNLNTEFNPPDLIIQDELHLISGPLGSMTGLLELTIDFLCSKGDFKPKVIGSTATIQRASQQILSLFDREVFQFPPPLLNADNSFFAKKSTVSSGRIYLGITNAGRTGQFMMSAISGSLLQSINDDSEGWKPEDKDPYTTLCGYFNSIRELGGARTLLWEDAQKAKGVYAKIRNENEREVNDLQELTGQISQEELKQALMRLQKTADHDDHIDMLLASVMLSVGVNIPRLGLMVVNGQPKTMSEYIQATSRVRRNEIPGLIITLFSNSKVRDRSHFETFCSWHNAFYRHVEATSVTPFSSRSRDKGLKALVVALALREAMMDERNIQLNADRKKIVAEKVIPKILKRVQSIDSMESEQCRNEINNFLDEWESRDSLTYLWNDQHINESLFISAEMAAQGQAAGRFNAGIWVAPNSARDVEPDVNIKIRRFLSRDFVLPHTDETLTDN
ncbi:MAG TPA: DNA helicase, partial [Deltaproteobacteria bacterium]|nr:DNA helicase [Deltaproteobacteria bacterium]